jgi:hypothetical protein
MVKRKSILLGSILLIAGSSLTNATPLFKTKDLQSRILNLNKVNESDILKSPSELNREYDTYKSIKLDIRRASKPNKTLSAKKTIKLERDNNVALNTDQKKIAETINTHLSGIKEGKIKLIESAWLKSSARVTEINQGRVLSKDIDQCFALWAKEPTKNLNEKIISIQLTSENVAIAQISLLWKGNSYEDTLTLIKTEKGWKIIGKIYNSPVIRSKRIDDGGYGG